MDSLEGFSEERNFPASTASDGAEPGGSRLQRMGIILFGVCCFLLFLLLKLPEARIQNLIIAHIRIATQQQGFLFSAEKVRIGMLFGPSLKMYNVELKSIDNERHVLKIPYLRVSPNIVSLVTNTKAANVSAELLDGSLSGKIGASQTGFIADLDLNALNLGATQLLKKFLPLDLSGQINGQLKLDFDAEQPQAAEGAVKLSLNNLKLPAQNFMGFNLPKLNISETKVDIAISHGQLVVREFNAGKDIKTDDIVGRLSGDGTLDRMLDRTKINAKATFELSQSVIQSFPLLDALLGPAKSADGKFVYRLTGPLSALEALPGG